MKVLILGLVIFLGIHLVPTFAGARTRLIEKFGEFPYKILYSLIALVGLLTIIVGMIHREFVPLWVPPMWGKQATVALMIPAVILLVAAEVPNNIKRFTRHPMLWGISLWAGAHLLANGDLASLLLFGSFGGFALFDMWSANRRGAEKSSRVYPIARDFLVVGIGCAVYAVLLFTHIYFTGLSVLPL